MTLTNKKFPLSFWLLNFVQMLEKLAYWIVLLQLPVYIAQKDVHGGLHWDQMLKGIIFFWWALSQNLTPIFTGGLADRYGHKKLALISFITIIAGYVLIATQSEFIPFLSGAVILGIGSGIFKPAIQGSIAGNLNEKNSSAGWGFYFLLLNLAVFFGPPISKYLKEISWNLVFLSAVFISFINFLIVLLMPKGAFVAMVNSGNLVSVLQKTFATLATKRVFLLVFFMSGFSVIYMQFYETLPHFILDWSDTSSIASILPSFMTSLTPSGIMISYEWLYNINSVLIILFIAWISIKTSKYRKESVLFAGIFLAIIGLILSGASTSGYLLILGIIIYTFGEMIVNPKYAEKLSLMAGTNEKAMFLSYLNISSAIGLAGGSVLGAWLYKHFAEKSSLAIRFIELHYSDAVNSPISPDKALSTLSGLMKTSNAETSIILWKTYSPYMVWIPFLIIGILSLMGMHYYRKKFN